MAKKDELDGDIFKLQIDITGTKILAYNEDKTFFGEWTADKAIKKFIGKNLKIYVAGGVDKKGKLHIVRKVKNQPW